MDWQQIVSLMIVAVTALLLVRHEVKRRLRARRRVCGHDCGCSTDVLKRIEKEMRPTIRQRFNESVVQ